MMVLHVPSNRLHSSSFLFHSVAVPVHAMRRNSPSNDEFLFFFICKRLTYSISMAFPREFIYLFFESCICGAFFVHARNENVARIWWIRYRAFFFVRSLFQHRIAQNQESNVINISLGKSTEAVWTYARAKCMNALRDSRGERVECKSWEIYIAQ